MKPTPAPNPEPVLKAVRVYLPDAWHRKLRIAAAKEGVSMATMAVNILCYTLDPVAYGRQAVREENAN